MTMWTATLLAAVICLALKVVGYLVPAGWLEHERSVRIADLLTVALLGALVAVQTVGSGMAVVLDARVPAVVVAGVLLRLRAPFLVVVVVAAAVAALLRLVGWTA
ncbi:AzlD domain-containing protein [Cellulomonas telluris]|uniref:AzlD domain-containing protein n=1 Tax=Cellulomonas telluris TaxID=2306636 RepID=UPI0010A78A8C|nr:AzlD domain-containing protein [Cellulomonas telluris]